MMLAHPGILGTGVQARWQLRYLRSVSLKQSPSGLTPVVVWGRSRDKAGKFQTDMVRTRPLVLFFFFYWQLLHAEPLCFSSCQGLGEEDRESLLQNRGVEGRRERGKRQNIQKGRLVTFGYAHD